MAKRTESPNWDRQLVTRLPDVHFRLIDNEAIANCETRSDVVRRAIRHYFRCELVKARRNGSR